MRSTTVDPRIRAHGPGQLAVADVDGEDPGRAALEQHLGEATGGGTRVEAVAALHAGPAGKASSAPISLCAPRDT